MHEKEIQYFTEAFQLTQERFYVDAIHKFQSLIDEFPESDLADDAMYNIGFCYYEMTQLQKSIEVLEDMIEKFPDATITVLENGNEFGKTVAKAYYLIVQCYIGLGDIQKAESILPILVNFKDTYILKNNQKIFFVELAREAIHTYNQLITN